MTRWTTEPTSSLPTGLRRRLPMTSTVSPLSTTRSSRHGAPSPPAATTRTRPGGQARQGVEAGGDVRLGLAAPETAGSATAGSAMGSLLALGLPTSATAALLLAAFQQYGMPPGPLLFERNGEIVWALLASLFVAMVALLVLNLPFAPLWAKLLEAPQTHLYAGITVFASLGVYATGASTTDLALMCALGVLAYVMRRNDVPIAPVLIAVILGPLAEYSLRDAMANSGNDPLTLVSSPLTIVLYTLLVLGVAWATWQRTRARRSVDF